MKILRFKDKHYLQLKDHTFEVLNYFEYNELFWIQCTSNNKVGIVKEYLPDKWELQKSRYSGQMIFTIYKKAYSGLL